MRLMIFLKRFTLIAVLIVFVQCDNQKKRIKEINYLSQIYIPPNSEILNYHDNLESSVAYKIRIDKNELKEFIEKNKFKALDTLDNKDESSLEQSIERSIEHSSFHSIENGFIGKEEIYGDNLKIYQKYSTIIILNQEASIIWGITDYPVTLPDSIRIKKPSG